MNRKGVFFTILSIFVSVMLIAMFTYQNQFPVDSDVEINTLRITFFHDFNNDLKNSYLERALYVSVYNALDYATIYADSNLFFSSDSDIETFLDTCLKGTNPACGIDASFTHWVDKIKDKVYDDFKIDLTYSISGDVILSQTIPFSIHVSIPVTYTLSDDFVLRLWNSEVLDAEVSITGLIDPLLLKQLSINRRIIRDPMLELRDDDNANPHDDFVSHYNSGTYVMSDFGPSFLMRLKGSLANSTLGLQTLLKVGEVVHQANMSYIDYKYIKGEEYLCASIYTNLYNIDTINTNFRIGRFDTFELYKLGDLLEITEADCG